MLRARPSGLLVSPTITVMGFIFGGTASSKGLMSLKLDLFQPFVLKIIFFSRQTAETYCICYFLKSFLKIFLKCSKNTTRILAFIIPTVFKTSFYTFLTLSKTFSKVLTKILTKFRKEKPALDQRGLLSHVTESMEENKKTNFRA